jgi:pyruvate dehydrogenase E2 component (dihydrolipoamide acetyltransferase)
MRLRRDARPGRVARAEGDLGRAVRLHAESLQLRRDTGVLADAYEAEDRGLIAPVIRDADKLGVIELAQALAEIAHKARTASFAVNDTRGGTYTISNVGAFGGSRNSTPIITPPQVAVLALGRTRMMPWVVDGELKPRLIMPLSHSFDHRITDGGPEVQFMQHIIADLENPGRLLL